MFNKIKKVSYLLTELSSEKHGWHCLNYAETFDLSLSSFRDNVERIDVSKVSTEEFVTRYEKTYTPAVLTNVQEDWPAKYKWTLDVSLYSFSKNGNL